MEEEDRNLRHEEWPILVEAGETRVLYMPIQVSDRVVLAVREECGPQATGGAPPPPLQSCYHCLCPRSALLPPPLPLVLFLPWAMRMAGSPARAWTAASAPCSQ